MAPDVGYGLHVGSVGLRALRYFCTLLFVLVSMGGYLTTRGIWHRTKMAIDWFKQRQPPLSNPRRAALEAAKLGAERIAEPRRTSRRRPLKEESPMASWQPDLYAKAWQFATRYHHGQSYGGPNEGEQIAYINHLASVAMEVTWALQFDSEADGNLAVQCALLHDVIEDTPVSFDQLEATFGAPVAHGVLALSKNADLPKAEQLPDSLVRILKQPREIAMVKLADRISNLYHPPFYWGNGKIHSYQDEAKIIHAALGDACPPLAQRLQQKIDIYLDFCSPSRGV
jgi:hypothetical protein